MARVKTFAAALACSIAASSLGQHVPVRGYRVQQLRPTWASGADGYGLNNHGEVTGRVSVSGTFELALWRSPGVNNDDALRIGHPAGGVRTEGKAVNDSGVIVGWTLTSDAVVAPMRWDAVTGAVMLPFLDDSASCCAEANAINAGGFIVGKNQRSTWPSYEPCLWLLDGTPVPLGSLGHPSGIGNAYDINDAGWIVGWSQTPIATFDGEANHGFLSDGVSGMIDLPTLVADGHAYARAINNSMVIVGDASDESHESFPVYWDGSGIHRLGSGASGIGRCTDINDHGVIIGIAGGRPVVWDAERVRYDLINLMQQPIEATPQIAYAINNDGVIVGRGPSKSLQVGFILTPIFCDADLNRDNFVDAIDYDEYVRLFAVADEKADYDGDGFVDAIDLDAFIIDFLGTC